MRHKFDTGDLVSTAHGGVYRVEDGEVRVGDDEPTYRLRGIEGGRTYHYSESSLHLATPEEVEAYIERHAERHVEELYQEGFAYNGTGHLVKIARDEGNPVRRRAAERALAKHRARPWDERVANYVERGKMQGLKWLGERSRDTLDDEERVLIDAAIEKAGFNQFAGLTWKSIKKMRGWPNYKRWLAEAEDSDLRIDRIPEIRSWSSYSPDWIVYLWRGKYVFVVETKHNYREVFLVPEGMEMRPKEEH